MKGIDIVNRARSLNDCVYWYGGKRQKASRALADLLRSANPSIWNENYYNKAIQDISFGRRVCDCSGLVCYAYNIPDIGSSEIRKRFKVWKGSPRPGMIGWKPGHVGIIMTCSGKVIEMRGIDYDYSESRFRKSVGFNTLLYDPKVEY